MSFMDWGRDQPVALRHAGIATRTWLTEVSLLAALLLTVMQPFMMDPPEPSANSLVSGFNVDEILIEIYVFIDRKSVV